MADERPLTRLESRELGRAEYLNQDNAGKSSAQVYKEKFSKNGTSRVWRDEFINGWYWATMLDDETWAEWVAQWKAQLGE